MQQHTARTRTNIPAISAALLRTTLLLITVAMIAQGCTPPLKTPSQRIDAFIQQAREECNAVCEGAVPKVVFAQLPNNTTLYATNEAFCAKYQDRLFCNTCSCAITPNMNLFNVTSDGQMVYCTYAKQETDLLTVHCSDSNPLD